MISGLYYTTLERLAAPTKLRITKDELGMKFYMRYKSQVIKFIVSAFELNNYITDEVLVTLIENKIVEARDKLLVAST